MALPRKKRRNITLDAHDYFWLIGKPKLEFYKRENTSAAPVALLHVNVVIEHSSGKAKIVADFHGLFALCVPSLGFSNAQNIIITPAIVTMIINYAKQEYYWTHEQSGELKLNQAQLLFPEAVWEGFDAINTEYDSGKINEYVSGLTKIWP